MCVPRFTAFRLSDGKEAWWVGGLSFQACSTPVVAGDRLIISAAGSQGERANMTLPPPFDEAVKKYDENGDGLISCDEIPADLRKAHGLPRRVFRFSGRSRGAHLHRLGPQDGHRNQDR
jgi:hypothetical protein